MRQEWSKTDKTIQWNETIRGNIDYSGALLAIL